MELPDEDRNVLVLSEMFVAVPATTIRRILRESQGSMEETAAKLIEINESALKARGNEAPSPAKPSPVRPPIRVAFPCQILTFLFKKSVTSSRYRLSMVDVVAFESFRHTEFFLFPRQLSPKHQLFVLYFVHASKCCL